MNRPAAAEEEEGVETGTPDEGDFVFPEQITESPTVGEDPSPGGVDPSLYGGADPELPGSPILLSPCLPLDRPNCGLLANPGLTDGLLEFVEAGNTGTDQVNIGGWIVRQIEAQVNAFLDSALGQAASTLAPVQVQVDPGDLQV